MILLYKDKYTCNAHVHSDSSVFFNQYESQGQVF